MEDFTLATKTTKPKAQRAAAIFNKQYGVKTPKEIKDAFMKLGMTKNYANTFYYNLKKEAEG